jgi:hypothetical protein
MTMLEILSAEQRSLLLSLSTMKKLAFPILLFDRMLPEIHSYFLASGRDFSIIQQARERFWRLLSSWSELRETILDLLPDSEDDGSAAAQFARYAGLVAADIAGLVDDGQDSHVTEPIEYALESYTPQRPAECKYWSTIARSRKLSGSIR